MIRIETVFENKNITIKSLETKSGEVFTFVENVNNRVAVLPFAKIDGKNLFFVKSIKIPFWNPNEAEIVAISYKNSGKLNVSDQTLQFIQEEFHTKITSKEITHIGACRISTNQSGIVELYTADLSNHTFDACDYKSMYNLTDVSDPVLYTLLNKAERLVF